MSFEYLDLISLSVNFHGHELLKELAEKHGQPLCKLKNIDYKRRREQEDELHNIGQANRAIVKKFIILNALSVFSLWKLDKNKQDDSHYEDKYRVLPPLDYYLLADFHMVREQFTKTISRGSILICKVLQKSVSSYLLHLLCFDCGPHMNLLSAGIRVHMRHEDTVVDELDADFSDSWNINTKLRVEVLLIDDDGSYVLVGTKGVTLTSRTNVLLGKLRQDDLPPIIRQMSEIEVDSFMTCLKRMKSFKNPKSIEELCSQRGISLNEYPSSMSSLKHNFPVDKMYFSLRKVQMTRWAHKSVADGVTLFKQGKHEMAFQCLTKAIQIDSENVEAYVAKGALLANLGHLEMAINDFEKARKYNPSHTNACNYMCETLVELGTRHEENKEIEKAVDCYNQCLSIKPDHAKAKESLINMKKTNRICSFDLDSFTVLNEENALVLENEKTTDKNITYKEKPDRILSPFSQRLAELNSTNSLPMLNFSLKKDSHIGWNIPSVVNPSMSSSDSNPTSDNTLISEVVDSPFQKMQDVLPKSVLQSIASAIKNLGLPTNTTQGAVVSQSVCASSHSDVLETQSVITTNPVSHEDSVSLINNFTTGKTSITEAKTFPIEILTSQPGVSNYSADSVKLSVPMMIPPPVLLVPPPSCPSSLNAVESSTGYSSISKNFKDNSSINHAMDENERHKLAVDNFLKMIQSRPLRQPDTPKRNSDEERSGSNSHLKAKEKSSSKRKRSSSTSSISSSSYSSSSRSRSRSRNRKMRKRKNRSESTSSFSSDTSSCSTCSNQSRQNKYSRKKKVDKKSKLKEPSDDSNELKKKKKVQRESDKTSDDASHSKLKNEVQIEKEAIVKTVSNKSKQKKTEDSLNILDDMLELQSLEQRLQAYYNKLNTSTINKKISSFVPVPESQIESSGKMRTSKITLDDEDELNERNEAIDCKKQDAGIKITPKFKLLSKKCETLSSSIASAFNPTEQIDELEVKKEKNSKEKLAEVLSITHPTRSLTEEEAEKIQKSFSQPSPEYYRRSKSSYSKSISPSQKSKERYSSNLRYYNPYGAPSQSRRSHSREKYSHNRYPVREKYNSRREESTHKSHYNLERKSYYRRSHSRSVSGSPPYNAHRRFDQSRLHRGNSPERNSRQTSRHTLSRSPESLVLKDKDSPIHSARFGKWAKEENTVQSKIPKKSQTLDEMENYVKDEMDKRKEEMKERNKEFLKKPPSD